MSDLTYFILGKAINLITTITTKLKQALPTIAYILLSAFTVVIFLVIFISILRSLK